jgi:hypothetical protein
VLNAIKTTRGRNREGQRFSLWILRISSFAALLAALLCGASLRSAWGKFQTDLTTYHGVAIGMTKTEVQYALGAPQTVQGSELVVEGIGKVSSPLRVNPMEENKAIPEGYDPIPTGKSAMDYDSWHFWNQRGSFDVEFNFKSHRVDHITCYVAEPSQCDSLFGIARGTREALIIEKLGKPDKTEISGGDMIEWGREQFPVQVTKTMDYDRLGIRLNLAKKAVTSISKSAPQETGLWWWLTNGRIS